MRAVSGESGPVRSERGERARQWLSRWIVSPLFGMKAGDWAKLLVEARGRVSPCYWPRAVLTSLSCLVNSVEAVVEERRFGAALRACVVREPLFVLGHYRSGTTHLHNLLALDPRCTFTDNLCATHPHSFLSAADRKRRLGAALTMRRRPQDEVRLDLLVPAEDELALCAASRLSPHLAWHFPSLAEKAERCLDLQGLDPVERERWKQAMLGFARKLSLRSGGRRVVLKSPCHTARIATLLELFPDARFAHIRRDPLEVFRSTMHMERSVQPHFAYQRRDPAGLEEMVLRRYRLMYEAFFRDLERIPPGQFHELDYEELEREPAACLERVYAALGLGTFEPLRRPLESYLRSVQGYRRNRYEPLDPEQAARVARAWAPFLERWGRPATGGRA
jgi:hypothetical protein